MTELNRAALLVVTPHSSGAVPADILRDMLGDDLFDTPKREALLRRLFLDGDPYTDLIYAVPGARLLAAPWSRFAVDLNRERGDQAENGVLKLTTFDRQPLYPPGFQLSGPAREARLRRHWDTFDAQLAAELPATRLMIVGHCMAPQGPQLGPDTGTPRPAICLMTGTPDAPTFPRQHWEALRQHCADAFAPLIEASPYRDVSVGVPWTTDTLSASHHARSGVAAFGIELNSGLYLNSQAEPLDEVIRGLNASFARFADAALALLEP
ncbi:N-formylglutamate amidohydrolase [Deinococcus fonticola]|uniref:N-formylglutamate amidohydrolase n=1 Tax=Deinococcus fonticola TaxID=2528713 RepID=UPI001074DFA0|nr:N-formylglutamate amidohydrolase [Deinococcus fonticola]